VEILQVGKSDRHARPILTAHGNVHLGGESRRQAMEIVHVHCDRPAIGDRGVSLTGAPAAPAGEIAQNGDAEWHALFTPARCRQRGGAQLKLGVSGKELSGHGSLSP